MCQVSLAGARPAPGPIASLPSRTGSLVLAALSLGLWLGAAGARAADLPALETSARDSLVAALQKERIETEEWLRSKPTSYLAAVRRMDFGQRATLTLGRAAGNDLRLDDSTIAGRHLRVTVAGDSFVVEAVDPGARFRSGDAERTAGTLPPSSIGVGRFTVRLSHQRFPALIVFDPQSPRFREFKGLDYFPVDLAYRYVVRLEPNPKPDTVVILSTRGNERRAVRAGWFSFRVGGRKVRLEATRLLEPGVGENDLGVFFKDATNGRETYGMGRYLDPEPLSDGAYVLDFNRAYNPACAFSDHYNCPIPPRQNVLKVAIRAGEKDAHYLTH